MFRENREFVFIIIYAAYDDCKYSDTIWLADRTRLFVQYTISLSSLRKPIWSHWTYKMPVRYILSSVWVRLSIFSTLSIIKYVGLYVFSLPMSVVMIERIYILCLIIIIKLEVWTITHCIGLGHETMVSAVCLSIFLWKRFPHYSWWRHQMETFSALLTLCAGNSPVTGEFPSQRPLLFEKIQEFTCHRWSPLTKGQYRGALLLFCCCQLQQIVEQTVELPVIWYALALRWRHFNIWNIPAVQFWSPFNSLICTLILTDYYLPDIDLVPRYVLNDNGNTSTVPCKCCVYNHLTHIDTETKIRITEVYQRRTDKALAWCVARSMPFPSSMPNHHE